ncbi:Phosphotransferase enzyme [Aspergillus alliaceus]|uniref:Altered inheritance of mitochondria protein 9, mitochondrial n=1 Tax=Petromyces alliaceus TaxID=209559 RepID=A0A8H6AAN3_PETAA|nr:Phosphotransferase enzyme [Aspergillus burnettii]
MVREQRHDYVSIGPACRELKRKIHFKIASIDQGSSPHRRVRRDVLNDLAASWRANDAEGALPLLDPLERFGCMVEPETSTQVSLDFSGVIEVRLSTSSGEDSFRITLWRTPVLPFNLSSYFFPFFIFSGLIHVVKLLKYVEGQFNKAFILTMSSGDEIVARLPYSNAGPAFYTITSEIATRNFLRDVLDIPIPRVYAWSAETSNPVGAEYIVEENATGQPLGKLWDTLPIPERLEVVNQIVAVEKKLASIPFPKHGCIYYESDLKSRSHI